MQWEFSHVGTCRGDFQIQFRQTPVRALITLFTDSKSHANPSAPNANLQQGNHNFEATSLTLHPWGMVASRFRFQGNLRGAASKGGPTAFGFRGGMLYCFRGYTGIIEMTWKLQHSYRGYIGIMEKKIETTTFWFAAYRGNGTLALLNTCYAILGSQPIE